MWAAVWCVSCRAASGDSGLRGVHVARREYFAFRASAALASPGACRCVRPEAPASEARPADLGQEQRFYGSSRSFGPGAVCACMAHPVILAWSSFHCLGDQSKVSINCCIVILLPSLSQSLLKGQSPEAWQQNSHNWHKMCSPIMVQIMMLTFRCFFTLVHSWWQHWCSRKREALAERHNTCLWVHFILYGGQSGRPLSCRGVWFCPSSIPLQERRWKSFCLLQSQCECYCFTLTIVLALILHFFLQFHWAGRHSKQIWKAFSFQSWIRRSFIW